LGLELVSGLALELVMGLGLGLAQVPELALELALVPHKQQPSRQPVPLP
jgi:hypothetical protein